ncbi:cytochrome P450 monooxygenase protein [Rutstroemia sp. NJR-2017a BVV2]|nr:cytochrome P450 monooxygenase protein [Rutstroemia sp. NJR-2017a BVV2]
MFHQGIEHLVRLAAHERLGPVIRVAPNEVSVNCIEDGVRTIYGGAFEKGEWYGRLRNYGHPYMFIMQSNKQHSSRKRILTHFYSNSHILTSRALTSILSSMIHNRYLPQLRNWASTSLPPSPHNIYRLNKGLFLDITTHFLFGPSHTSNFTSSPQETALLHTFELALSKLFWSMDAPHLTRAAGRLGFRTIPARVSAAQQELEALILGWCGKAKGRLLSKEKGEKEEEEEEPSAYHLLYTALSQSSIYTTPTDLDHAIAAELFDHILASHEISAIMLTYLMYELSRPRNAHILSSLRAELAALGPEPTPQQIDTLPYLSAIVQETLRLYPASSGPFTRIVPKGGTVLGGYKVPEGTVVAASAYTLHANEEVFPGAGEWLPERWLVAEEEEKRRMGRWWWAFGSGGRMCVGSHLALRMIKAAAVAVYSEFDTVVVPETRIEQIPGIISHPVGHSVMLGVKMREG